MVIWYVLTRHFYSPTLLCIPILLYNVLRAPFLFSKSTRGFLTIQCQKLRWAQEKNKIKKNDPVTQKCPTTFKDTNKKHDRGGKSASNISKQNNIYQFRPISNSYIKPPILFVIKIHLISISVSKTHRKKNITVTYKCTDNSKCMFFYLLRLVQDGNCILIWAHSTLKNSYFMH